jgi:predicted nuclease of predicted toxin-antitoxin system
MRVLLDECVPIPLKREFAEFDARTVRDMRWLTITNGELLLKAAEEFDAVLTVDVGMDVSLTRSGARIGVVLIRAHRTSPKALLPHIDAARAALRTIKPGQFVVVGG